MPVKKTKATSKDETQQVVIPMPKKLHRELKFLSVDRDRTMNAMIIEAIEAWWKDQPEFGKYPPLNLAGKVKAGLQRRRGSR